MALASYKPEPLPIQDIDYGRLIALVGQANAALARYDGLLQAMVNPTLMLSPLTNEEAILSSRIEGTVATLEEVLEFEAGQEQDEIKTRDIQEIFNYRSALRKAQIQLSDRRPIVLSLIRMLHLVLMDSVRGKDKTPGEFRKDQNYIGRVGQSVEEASFVPPNPLQLMDHLQAWEQYLRYQDIDPIIQAAIVHAQFELIHPFKDGNGRIGRLIIPLFLYSKGSLSTPMFYLSAYFESNRDEYIARLQNISRERDWVGWVEFFLCAVAEQAKTNTSRVKQIMQLYDEMKELVRLTTHSQHSAQIVDALFERTTFQISEFSDRTGISKQMSHILVRQLQQAGIVTVIRPGAGQRAAIYAFPRLVNLAEGRTVFKESSSVAPQL